jgi:UDP-N-acetylmuramoyl-tripeptide--D-alanyl-D-alanine ligase
VTSACATLGDVTDPGRSTVPDSPDRNHGDADAAAFATVGTPDPAAPFLTSDDIVAATGGTLLRRSGRRVAGGAVDSRLVVPGSLFVALAGERTDGHRFLAAAAGAGAAAFLVGRLPDPAAGEPPLEALGDVTVVLVADPLRALHAVAASWRRRFDTLVVGVTGSIAKTSTKEAVAGVLACRYETLRTEGNQNNEVGMPLTVLRLGPQHGAAVLEMGMYTGGEIRDLAAIGLPSIGIVTAIEPVHLSRIGSVEAIVDAKAELLEALPSAAEGGVAILNADDPRVISMAARTRARVVTYGFSPEAGIRATDVASAGFEGMRFRLVTPAGERVTAIPALGRLAVHNALAAAAVGLAAGLELDELLPGLSAGSTAPHRSVVIRAGGVEIVDDSYNAAPGSVRAALELLAGLPGRRVAVLGEMRELGPAHATGHREVGEAAGDMLDLLVVVDGGPGGAAEGITRGALSAGLAPDRVVVVADAGAAVEILEDRLAPGDVVLVKASRGVALERVVDGLVATLGGPEAGA